MCVSGSEIEEFISPKEMWLENVRNGEESIQDCTCQRSFLISSRLHCENYLNKMVHCLKGDQDLRTYCNIECNCPPKLVVRYLAEIMDKELELML